MIKRLQHFSMVSLLAVLGCQVGTGASTARTLMGVRAAHVSRASGSVRKSTLLKVPRLPKSLRPKRRSYHHSSRGIA